MKPAIFLIYINNLVGQFATNDHQHHAVSKITTTYLEKNIVATLLLLLQALQLQSLNVLAFSAYDFHLLRTWMQLIQFSILGFFVSFLMSSSHLFFGLPCGRIDIGFHLHTFFTILSSGIRC